MVEVKTPTCFSPPGNKGGVLQIHYGLITIQDSNVITLPQASGTVIIAELPSGTRRRILGNGEGGVVTITNHEWFVG